MKPIYSRQLPGITLKLRNFQQHIQVQSDFLSVGHRDKTDDRKRK